MATSAQIRTWLNTPNQKPESNVYKRNWLADGGKCQALMWQFCYQFGTAPQAYNSAAAAMNASGALNGNADAALPGSYHYWDYGKYGHVALELGGGLCLMASALVDEFWGNGVGIINVHEYTRRTGLRYRGWSATNGRNDAPVEGAAPSAPQPIPAPVAQPSADVYMLDLPVWWYRYDSAADARAGRLRKGYGVGKGSYLIVANEGGALQIVLPDGSRTWMHPKAGAHVRVIKGSAPAVTQAVHLTSWWYSYDSARDAINGRIRRGKGFGPGAFPVVRVEDGAVLVSGTPLGDQWLHPKARSYIR